MDIYTLSSEFKRSFVVFYKCRCVWQQAGISFPVCIPVGRQTYDIMHICGTYLRPQRLSWPASLWFNRLYVTKERRHSLKQNWSMKFGSVLNSCGLPVSVHIAGRMLMDAPLGHKFGKNAKEEIGFLIRLWLGAQFIHSLFGCKCFLKWCRGFQCSP